MANLIRWDPFRDLQGLNFNFDQLFREFVEPEEMMGEEYCVAPPVESFRHDGSFVVKVDLPGVNPKDVHLTFDRGELTIEGERKRAEEIQENVIIRDELCYGSFRRTLDMPDGIKSDQMKAKYHDGVLEITAPVEEQFLPKKIEVKVQKG